MARRKTPAPASPVKAAPAKGRPGRAKAAPAATQPDLLDLLTEKPKATRTRARKDEPGSEG